jgi:DNA polymerase-3 subunit epsilon
VTTSWSVRAMLAFDTETSGVDVETARIVTACLAAVNTTVPEAPISWLVDPGIEIPTEATAVHGVTTEHAREHGEQPRGVLMDIRARLIDAWEMGRPVVAFNAPYDLTVLDRELRRHDLPALDVHGLVVDPLVLDRHLDKWRKGSRKLDAVCRNYQVALDGAHDSTQDALAAARVAWRMFRMFPELDAMDGDDLYALQVDAHRDWADGFEAYLRSQGKGDVIDRSWPVRTWQPQL